MVPPTPGSSSSRIASIDLLRGVVMVLMALDHTRTYFGDLRLNPHDLSVASPALFFTRWVTHFCAPVFVLLAGTSAYLYGQRRPRLELARFLISRGLWLLVLEFTIIKISWMYDIAHPFSFFQVIAVIGAAFLVLGALCFLPQPVLLVLGLLIVAGHNLLDSVAAEETALPVVFQLLHEGNAVIGPKNGMFLIVVYPILPWTGLLLLGYGLGPLFLREPARRRRALVLIGAGASALFVVLRAFNLYGQPEPWTTQDSALMTVASFLNCLKYPPSLQYLLMTLGPAFLVLAWLDARSAHDSRLGRVLLNFGRVPLFYYVVHMFVIHLGSSLLYMVDHGEFLSPMQAPFTSSFPPWFGYGLGVVYSAWVAVVVLLVFPCAWYARLRQRKSWWILRYL